ncbi:MAG: 2-dehydro-3-deoxygalactonokinase [Verrucomicrobiota bacterium]
MNAFYSCDWGTTSFRLRRIDAATGEILSERRQPMGVKMLLGHLPTDDQPSREKQCEEFLRAQLLSLVDDQTHLLAGAEVLISGMASSSVGWRELAYAMVPVRLDGSGLVQARFDLQINATARAHVRLISGVRTGNNIMRGEETELLGIFAEGKFDALARHGLVILPGTHSKHIRLEHRRMTDFQTYMTGELFEVLSSHSLLRASVEPTVDPSSPGLLDRASRDAFLAGVDCAAQAGLAAGLFRTRVRTVLNGVQPAVNRWFLSGLLIGAEAADFGKFHSATPVLIAAPEPLSTAYALAFEHLGPHSSLTVLPPERMASASVRGHRVLLAGPHPVTEESGDSDRITPAAAREPC